MDRLPLELLNCVIDHLDDRLYHEDRQLSVNGNLIFLKGGDSRLAQYSTVSNIWKGLIEARTFKKLTLHNTRDDLQNFFKHFQDPQRQPKLRHLQFSIDHCTPLPTDPERFDDNVVEYVQLLLSHLQTWNKDPSVGPLKLEVWAGQPRRLNSAEDTTLLLGGLPLFDAPLTSAANTPPVADYPTHVDLVIDFEITSRKRNRSMYAPVWHKFMSAFPGTKAVRLECHDYGRTEHQEELSKFLSDIDWDKFTKLESLELDFRDSVCAVDIQEGERTTREVCKCILNPLSATIHRLSKAPQLKNLEVHMVDGGLPELFSDTNTDLDKPFWPSLERLTIEVISPSIAAWNFVFEVAQDISEESDEEVSISLGSRGSDAPPTNTDRIIFFERLGALFKTACQMPQLQFLQLDHDIVGYVQYIHDIIAGTEPVIQVQLNEGEPETTTPDSDSLDEVDQITPENLRSWKAHIEPYGRILWY